MKKLIKVLISVTFLVSINSSSICAEEKFKIGDQGSEIAEIQGRLLSLGYDVMADGYFGCATSEAIKDFQMSQGFDPNGFVDSMTYSALLGRDMSEVSRSSNYVTRRIIQSSMNYLGVPYVFGGTTPSGFDCSGYVRYVFAQAGIYLPRMADEQYANGIPISNDELQEGDLVFFSTYTYGASHVGIYLGNGDFINASSSRGVAIDSLYSPYWGSHYIGARRVSF